jgi:spermidine synthase
MDKAFEMLDYQKTPLGNLMLRRRKMPQLNDTIVHEVIPNDEFLMSSLFHEAEEALASWGLKAAVDGPLDVIVGGLGLGYTAAAALSHPRLRSLQVIEALEPVIRWHQLGLVPLGKQITSDPRSQLILGDFFALARHPETGFDPATPGRPYHAILLDVDHTPGHWLHPSHAEFYQRTGLETLRRHLRPGGVFAMWSDGAKDEDFLTLLRSVFPQARAETITFPNPLRGDTSSSTIYIAA